MIERQPWFVRLPALGALLLTCWTGASAPVRADPIDEALPIKGRELLTYLEKNRYVNVGVLPFRAGVEGQPLTFRNRPINFSMTIRVENWLLRHNALDRKINLLRDPGDEAAFKKEGASYRTPEGKPNPEGMAKLFRYKYPLLVDTKQPVSPDAFLTGEVALSIDRKKARVRFQIVARAQGVGPPELRDLSDQYSLEVSTDVSILIDFAEPFAVISNGLAKMPPAKQHSLVVESAANNREDLPQRGQTGEKLVQLLIHYNGVEKPIKPFGNAFQVEEPRANDKVAMTLCNVSDQKVGVLLAVNGCNTIYMEKVFETGGHGLAQCTKWILEPNQKVTITGFSLSDDKTVESFAVVDPLPGSAAEDLATWPRMGVIDLYVFLSSEKESYVLKSSDSALSLRKPLARRGDRVELKSWTKAFKLVDKINESESVEGKGRIVKGKEKEKLRLDTVTFPNPIFQEHRVIWYLEKK